MTATDAALLAALLLLLLGAFHASLAFGAPWGGLAWGGEVEQGPLPERQRLGSTLLAPFVLVMALVLLVRGGWLYPDYAGEMDWAVWAVFLFIVTQMFGALRSKSRREKRVMTPLYALGAALTAIVAFGGIA